MPANLPPQYYELEREYRAERDPREKLRIAEELLRMMPKHKGTDKLQADMKSKISRHKKETSDQGTQAAGAHRGPAHDYIAKEGAGQVILIGPPNSGKSSLIDVLTHAKPLVADYPFSTREPLPGMMPFETIQLQLIDTPPISPDSYENYMTNLVRNADLVVTVCDLADKAMLEKIEYVVSKLEEKRILLSGGKPEPPEDPRYVCKRVFLCAHKEYEDETGENLRRLKEKYPDFRTEATSILDDDSLYNMKRAIFESLDIIRVYTKNIGKEVEKKDPVILPTGGTVDDAALSIHKDFARKLKFAKIWGEGKFDGQRVNKEYALTDEDIIEFHI